MDTDLLKDAMNKRTMNQSERKALLKTQEVVVDSVVVGGEKFNRSSYMFAGRMYSHIHGCYGDRYYEASQRDKLIKCILINLK